MKGMALEFHNMIIMPLVALCADSGHFHIDLEDKFVMDQKKMLCETVKKLEELFTSLDEKKMKKTKVDEIWKEIVNRIEYDLRQLTQAYAHVVAYQKRYEIEMRVGQIDIKENLDNEIGQTFKELFVELKKPGNIGKKKIVESREIVYKLLCICQRMASIKQKENIDMKTALHMAFRQFATINLFIYHLSLDLDDVPTQSAAAAGTMGKIQKIAESWTNANDSITP
jgi:hypothetical protein